MAIPEADMHRIQLWCREVWPEEYWDQVTCEADVAGNAVTVVEVRTIDGAHEPIREVVARLRYTASTGLWKTYWCDRNLKFHEYKAKPATKDVQSLLDHIASHEDPIFFG